MNTATDDVRALRDRLLPPVIANNLRFPNGTPELVARVLAYAARGVRYRLWYGDPETGQSWHEENSVIGCIGWSTGLTPIPLLIFNNRSRGGMPILCENIVAMKNTLITRTLWSYRHPTFRIGDFIVRPCNVAGLPWEVLIDGIEHARFTTEDKAHRWVGFMKGERFSK
jgi:hypothetical protein